jgi:hypothetical protein
LWQTNSFTNFTAITNPLLRTMTDVHDKKTRSFNMSRIKGKDTKPEMVVKSLLQMKQNSYTWKNP